MGRELRSVVLKNARLRLQAAREDVFVGLGVAARQGHGAETCAMLDAAERIDESLDSIQEELDELGQEGE